MNSKTIKRFYDITYQVIKANTEGLTHEDSIIFLPAGGSCLNWVLGHLILSRDSVIKMLKHQPLWSDSESAPYQRGATAQDHTHSFFKLEKLLSDLDRSQELLNQALESIPEEKLTTQLEDSMFKTIAEWLLFFYFHESYHAGQLAVYRVIAGKPGVIK